MKKILFILCLLAYCQNAWSQKLSEIDLDNITKEIKKKKGEYNYAKMLKRFQDLDTTLTAQHYQHLYYGYAKQDYYNPMMLEDTQLFAFANQAKAENVEILKEQIEAVAKAKPISLDVCYANLVLFSLEKNKDKAKAWRKHFFGLLTAIATSGKGGKSSETAFVVTSIRDEYVVMMNLQLKFSSKTTTDCCDVFDLETPNKLNKTQIFFNKTLSSEYLKKIFDKK